MTTEKPLTRRELRERERAQFERLAAAQRRIEPVYEAPGHQPPTVVEAIAPAAVLASTDLYVEGPPPEPSQRITEIPVPDAAAPWPTWASKPVEMRSSPVVEPEIAPALIAAPAPDLVDSIAPADELFAAEVPAALQPHEASAEPLATDVEVALPEVQPEAAPVVHTHRTRPVTPVATPWASATTPAVPRRAPRARAVVASVNPRRPVVAKSTTPSLGRKVMGKVFSTAALLFAAALLVGSSIPANAFMQNTLGETVDEFEQTAAGQTMSVAEGALPIDGSARDGSYDVISPAELLAKKYGGNSDDYSAATTGSIRWPFPYSVSTSDGFGPRAAPCGGCSTFHNGLDFLPGNGKPIYAVAAGTVTFSALDGSLGQKLELEHVINGQPVQSVYAHMQLGSSPLQVGDQVKVGQFIGLVGATGIATAPHLHLEIHLAGVPVNPYAWLTANVN